jgi:hypothetical protein
MDWSRWRVHLWNKFSALSFTEVRRLIEATLLVLAADAALRALPSQWLFRSLRQKQPARTLDDGPDADRLARFVDMADRHIPGTSSCLRRAVALTYSFRRHGIPADLCIGVRRERDTLYAHAWVQTDNGATFGLSKEPAYAPLSGPSHSIGSCAVRS